jgi:hypothetical protein
LLDRLLNFVILDDSETNSKTFYTYLVIAGFLLKQRCEKSLLVKEPWQPKIL